MQLREQYSELQGAGAEVLAIAPHAPSEVHRFVKLLNLPFPCLADPERAVFEQYGVGQAVWSLGQRPAVFLISPDGRCAREWRGYQQWQIPTVKEIRAALQAERFVDDRTC